MTEKDPIINCHVHIFSGDHVPAHLTKTMLIWPFYCLINTHVLLWIAKQHRDAKNKIEHMRWLHDLKLIYLRIRNKILSFTLVPALFTLFNLWITVHVFFFALEWISGIEFLQDYLPSVEDVLRYRTQAEEWGILLSLSSFLKIVAVFYILVFYKWGRQLIFAVLSKVLKIAKLFPSSQWKDLIARYDLILRYSLYDKQAGIYSKLLGQYNEDSEFVVLPMDMEYMDAGPVGKEGNFHKQMEQLLDIKNTGTHGARMHPFLFIDPRRIEAENNFLNWEVLSDGKVQLNDCKVKTYLDGGCEGFKIYPALGYFPFDERLLPLWLYAAQNGIPIMTHCVIGTIYYRGKIKSEWRGHPILKRVGKRDANKQKTFSPLQLTQKKAKDFQFNFTHPVNYLCMLSEPILRSYIASCSTNTQELFGYHGPSAPMDRNLSSLKLCFAHFGGAEEWLRHQEDDRGQYARMLKGHPEKGIYHTGMHDSEKNLAWGKFEQHWQEVDWYTIICSLMVKFSNVYADISYILHEEKTRPLLTQTLNHPFSQLGDRVLFGTDFYVVRNHNSDKDLLAKLSAGLGEDHFDRIARENPKTYLANTMGA